MPPVRTTLAAIVIASSAITAAVAAASDAVPPSVAKMQQAALEDRRAYETLRSLTEEVGNRFAGTANDRKAVEWAMRTLQAQGFS